MASEIPISKEFGLNPSLLQCPCCGKEFAIAIFGANYRDPKTRKTVEAPHKIAMPNQLCDSCKDVIENKNGIFFIEVRDGEAAAHSENPYRTGRLIAISREAAEKMFGEIKSPINYMEKTMFEHCFGQALREQKGE